MTGKAKSGNVLFELIKEDFEYAREVYSVCVIAVCTDNGPDGKKACRLITEQFPHIATTVCWAHHTNLTVGDYLKLKRPFMDSIAVTFEIIKRFNNHQRALDLFKHSQLSLGAPAALSLFLPVLTRWTAHFCSIGRLQKVEQLLWGCATQFDRQIAAAAGDKPDQLQKGKDIVSSINNNNFWHDLSWFDHILLTLANLYWVFRNLSLDDPEDKAVMHGVHRSLELRWKCTDQEIAILAKALIDLVAFWELIHGTGVTQIQFVKLAIHILSIVPNSASMESTFSTFGNMHTKLRNCSNPDTIHKQTAVCMVRHQVHDAAGKIPSRKKHCFTLAGDSNNDELSAPFDPSSSFPSRSLVQDAEENELDHIDDGDNENTVPASQSSTSDTSSLSISVTNTVTLPRYIPIPLSELFLYPTPDVPADDLEFYWKGGIQSIETQIQEMDSQESL
ncbi:hypothetical protein V5O48_017960 [Marasmius crinis-equi]|uniref:HAT C-terminal dimerisation domain-containing protein n=1 Tax=Marasmius crinis-equi TaxID=585013 RepID=A0ABR3EMI4_9AGAR